MTTSLSLSLSLSHTHTHTHTHTEGSGGRGTERECGAQIGKHILSENIAQVTHF